jgi:hypothetical protein
MDNYLYLIIIIGLTIFIIFFGGHNKQNIVEYNSEYFDNLNTIIIFEKKLNNNLENIIFDSKDFININEFNDILHILIPNFIDCFYIRIKSFTLFNIFNLIKKDNIQNSMMVLFNHKKHNNLELLVGDSTNTIYSNYLHSNINIGYFYDLEKIISITGIYHIYNNSNETIIITCFILKKPFWHK